MNQVIEMENVGTAAVKRLRVKTLQNGHPFMINSNDLPSSQCYLEYPDGSISLVAISKSRIDFAFIRKLSFTESNLIKRMFNLEP